MKVILRQDIDTLGTMGELVNVKNGYARNYLIPQGFAFFASPSAMKALETTKKQYASKMLKMKDQAEYLASKLSDTQITISMQSGEESRLFGSVTNVMIAQELADRGFEIDRRTIVLDEPIKTLGTHEVKIKLHPEVVAIIKVWVISA